MTWGFDDEQALRESLRQHEATILHAYQDHLGFWTIGVGRLIDKRKGGGISREEAEFLLANDVAKVVRQLRLNLPWWERLDSVRARVLAEMAFQLGMGGLLKFSRTLKAVEVGDYHLAAHGMRESRWARQTPERAEKLARAMATGVMDS